MILHICVVPLADRLGCTTLGDRLDSLVCTEIIEKLTPVILTATNAYSVNTDNHHWGGCAIQYVRVNFPPNDPGPVRFTSNLPNVTCLKTTNYMLRPASLNRLGLPLFFFLTRTPKGNISTIISCRAFECIEVYSCDVACWYMSVTFFAHLRYIPR